MSSSFIDEVSLPGRRVELVAGDRAEPFDGYRLLGLVGQGQFAQVYCAMHRQMGELVAIKKTRHVPEQASQEPFVLKELCHDNVVCCRAIAQTQTGYQFVLDYCEAGTLRSHIESASLTFNQISAIAEDILLGLCYVHGQGVLHGDLKPENILLTYQTQMPPTQPSRLVARLGDFGSARFVELPSQSRKEIGSPTYAAPERFEGQSSYASDIYSVGVILYELLLGDRPFSGSPQELRQAHQTQSVVYSNIVLCPVQQFLSRALQKQPDDRYSSVEEMLRCFQSLPESALKLTYRIATAASATANAPQSYQPPRSKAELVDEPIAGEVRQLLSAPQGCFVVTDSTLSLLNLESHLTPVAQFSEPAWVSVSPCGGWLMALDKAIAQPAYLKGELISLPAPFTYKSRTVVYQGQLSAVFQSSPVQMVAISRRYLVNVLTSPTYDKSWLECFARSGKLIGNLSLNLSLAHATCAFSPYQIAALTSPADSEPVQIVLITLQPYQIKSAALSKTDLRSHPKGLSAFPWGFCVVDEEGCLFLDRAGRPVGRLEMTGISAIVPFQNGKALVARTQPSNLEKISPAENLSVGHSALFEIDLNALGLDLIL